MYKLIYACYHLPEECKCDGHHKIFMQVDREHIVIDHKEAIDKLSAWNSQLPCWKYAPISIERT